MAQKVVFTPMMIKNILIARITEISSGPVHTELCI
jgi:hypothetical protein